MASSKKFVAVICITLISLVAVGCSSDNSPVTTDRAPLDTAPPAIPANLGVSYDVETEIATISWDVNIVDQDLAGYVVARDHYGNVEYLVQTPAVIHAYVDDAPLPGISYYQVYAVDDSGNQSPVSAVQLVRPQTHQPYERQQ